VRFFRSKAESLRRSGLPRSLFPRVDLTPIVGETLRADDVVLLLTSGAPGGLIEALSAFAERRFPASCAA
jgi:hypothetical protein